MSKETHTPIQELELPEASTDEMLKERLLEMLRHDIPGFVLRHSVEATSVEHAAQIHEENVSRVKAALKEIHPKKRVRKRDIPGPVALDNQAIGWLHNDMGEGSAEPGTAQTEPLVHTTIAGAGKVHIAGTGSSPERIVEDDDYGVQIFMSSKDPNHPHNLLQRGLVDPTLIDPRVYSADINPGTSVVMSDNGRHSVWHRFDTDRTHPSERVAVATTLRDKTRRWARGKNTKPGFDLE